MPERERQPTFICLMMEHLGIEPGGAVVPRWSLAYTTAFHRCEGCTDKEACREWLECMPAQVSFAPRFCPSADIFFEWQVSPHWSSPYDVVIDKNEEAWTGSMISDQITRLNTKSGEQINYLLPRTINIRRVFVDNTTTPVTFWVGSNHGASIIKLEPLE